MSPRRQKRRRRGIVDTSVLAAGVAAFKPGVTPVPNSAKLLRDWLEKDTFVWLVSEDILNEYKAVLARLGVRRALIGTIINLLREEAEMVTPKGTIEAHPDPGDAPFWECGDYGRADFIVTLNRKHFPQRKLKAKVIEPSEPLPAATRGARDATPRRRR